MTVARLPADARRRIAAGIERAGRRRIRAVALAGALLAGAILASLGVGAVAIPPDRAISVLFSHLGLPAITDFAPRDDLIISAIRAPRTALGVLAGAALAASGAALQGLFRNPLADPALIGVSAGAALAAVAVIVLGAPLAAMLPAALAPSLLPVAAFAGGLAAIFVVYLVAARDGGADVATLLLAGAAVTALGNAGIGLLIFISDDQQIRDINFWLLGSLAGAHWNAIWPAAILMTVGVVGLCRHARALNAMSLGEADAYHLGFRPEQVKRGVVCFAALATGAAVALTGVIGFVGLMTPHIVRLLSGPDHKGLLPVSMLVGGALLLAADVVARSAAAPAEMPIGIVTAAIGGPFFLWLLARGRARGGWR